jgi:hypothetical protein
MNPLELKIEKGIQIPETVRQRSSKYRQLLEAMMPGDSVLIPKGKSIGSFRNYAKDGIKLRFRKVEGGIRMWRVE